MLVLGGKVEKGAAAIGGGVEPTGTIGATQYIGDYRLNGDFVFRLVRNIENFKVTVQRMLFRFADAEQEFQNIRVTENDGEFCWLARLWPDAHFIEVRPIVRVLGVE